MQQHPGFNPEAAACPQDSGTGPGAEATTPVNVDLALQRDCSAVATVHITRDHITITGILTMGIPMRWEQRWERRRGPGKGWALVAGPEDFMEAQAQLGLELAEYLDQLPFPFEVANLLPRPATQAASQAMAQAAKEVGHA